MESTFSLNSIKSNFLASIVVSLVAIPLCLGISLASGAPLFAGILTGIIGGIVVGILSESPFSVSGPAAGMIAVVLSSVSQLGSYETFLLALVIGGFIQLLAGVFRAGFVANYVPSTVIQGLLAAIGILIIVKQLPLAFGYSPTADTLQQSLIHAQEDTLSLAPLVHLKSHINIGATIITMVSLFILIFWEKYFPAAAKRFPAAILVVISAILINQAFALFAPELSLNSSHLVNIPVYETFSHLISELQHPNFSAWLNVNVYTYAFMIAIITSLETLLNLEAVEKLDQLQRYTSRNRELFAQGIGNMMSGLLGGLPITSVIVRSSVNINAGATNKLSTIFHGFLLLISLALIPGWLNYIPIAALAAILIHTGYKLTRVSLFKEVYSAGYRYFIPFIITTAAIVFTNLLLGIIIGLCVSIFFILRHNTKNCYSIIDEIYPWGKVLRIVLPQQITFINKAAIIEGLNRIPPRSKVIIDAQFTDYIDKDILEVIKNFKQYQAVNKKILVNLEGFKSKYYLGRHTNFINATTYDVQTTLSPEMILKILHEGNNRFMSGTPIHKNFKQQITATSYSQHPIAVVLSCSDSRVPIEIIFDLSVGDLFVTRVAGNVASDDVIGSIEYACKVAGAKVIIVLGHKECGAIKAACDNVHLGHVTQILDKIKPAIQMETETLDNRTSSNEQFVLNVTNNNVELTKDYLYSHSDIIKELLNNNEVKLVGGIYDVRTGQVEFSDQIYNTLEAVEIDGSMEPTPKAS